MTPPDDAVKRLRGLHSIMRDSAEGCFSKASIAAILAHIDTLTAERGATVADELQTEQPVSRAFLRAQIKAAFYAGFAAAQRRNTSEAWENSAACMDHDAQSAILARAAQLEAENGRS